MERSILYTDTIIMNKTIVNGDDTSVRFLLQSCYIIS